MGFSQSLWAAAPIFLPFCEKGKINEENMQLKS